MKSHRSNPKLARSLGPDRRELSDGLKAAGTAESGMTSGTRSRPQVDAAARMHGWPMKRHPRFGPVALRALAVFGLLVIGAVHLNLYANEFYDKIPTISWLFLLTVITAFLLALGLGAVGNLLVALGATAFSLSVLGGYVLALLLPNGLFLFKEPGISYSGCASIAAELLVACSCIGLIVLRLRGAAPRAVRELRGRRWI